MISFEDSESVKFSSNLTDQNLTGLDTSDSGHSVTAVSNAKLTRMTSYSPYGPGGYSCMIGYSVQYNTSW